MSRFKRFGPSLFAIGMVLIVAAYGAYSQRQAHRQRAAIAAFSSTIPLGMRKADAIRSCESAADQHRQWRFRALPKQENFGGLDIASVASPTTFGAQNWVVWIMFDEDAVVAVLVRTEDTASVLPDSAPRDRVDDPHHRELADLWLRE